jgi:hypothetical protein
VLIAAAVCPHPPLIVPELAGAAAPELDDLRAACASAITALADARPELLVVTGGAERTAAYPGDAAGTLRPWGVDVRTGTGAPCLPLSLTIGRWLLDRWRAATGRALPPLRFEAVACDAPGPECAALGRRIARMADRVALLTMGDGSARLTERSPGYVHPDAVPYDDMVADALATADLDRLAGLDPARTAELWVGGRAAFQVLAGAAEGAPPRRSELLYRAAPYGVSYFVAQWRWD